MLELQIQDRIMVNDDKTKDSLSAREKGDIYWQKLKNNLRAVRQKEADVDETRTGRAAALEILERFDERKDKLVEYTERITGNEFKRRPPTATGELCYKESILHVMLSLEIFKKIVGDEKKKEADDSEGSLSEHLEKIIPVIEKTLEVWFLANGIDKNSGDKISAEIQKSASSKLDKAIATYEDTIDNARRDVARMIVGRIKEDLSGQEESKSPGIDEFEALIAENRERYLASKIVIDKACTELRVLRAKVFELTKDISTLISYIEEKGEYNHVNRFMTYSDVLAEYMDYIADQLSAAVWAEACCADMLRGLLTDVKADPMIHNYIKKHWGVSVPTYEMNERISDIPEYTALAGIESDCALPELKSLEDASEDMLEMLQEVIDEDERPDRAPGISRRHSGGGFMVQGSKGKQGTQVPYG